MNEDVDDGEPNCPVAFYRKPPQAEQLARFLVRWLQRKDSSVEALAKDLRFGLESGAEDLADVIARSEDQNLAKDFATRVDAVRNWLAMWRYACDENPDG